MQNSRPFSVGFMSAVPQPSGCVRRAGLPGALRGFRVQGCLARAQLQEKGGTGGSNSTVAAQAALQQQRRRRDARAPSRDEEDYFGEVRTCPGMIASRRMVQAWRTLPSCGQPMTHGSL